MNDAERHQMLGAYLLGGLDKDEAAKQIAYNLLNPWHGLNGSLLRLDAGEQ